MESILIPVVLRFKQIAANSNINFTFTTEGVEWCLGATSGDSLGFSYNVLNGNPSADPQSAINRIEFNHSLLTIRTSGTEGTLYNFNVTLFLRVFRVTEYLQGYCTMGQSGSVLVNFGDEKTMEWRDGRFSAVLRHVSQQYRAVFLTVGGAKPGNRIEVNVTTKKGLGKVNWSLGPGFSQSHGIKMPENDTPIPVSSISYGNNAIVFQTGQAPGERLDFSLIAYITWLPHDLEFIYLQFGGNEGINVKAQVGSSQPQLLSRTSTLFTL